MNSMKNGVIAVATAYLLLTSATAIAEQRGIWVQGQAEREVAPDQLQIALSVEQRAPSADAALAAAGEAVGQLLAQLREVIPSRSIQALQIQLREVVQGTSRSWVRERGEPREMLATRSVSLNDVPIPSLAAIMAAVGQTAGVRVQSVQPTVSTLEDLQAELQRAAVANGRVKAQSLAAELDMQLGMPVFLDARHGYSPPRPMLAEARMMAVQSDAAPTAGYDAPGQVSLRSQVELRFELLPQPPAPRAAQPVD
jgi:uncharacterized protein YggE